MTPSVEIKLRPITIEAIQNDDENTEELFKEDVELERQTFIDFLKTYEGEKDHRGVVYDFDDIDSFSIDPNGSGSFIVYFQVNVYSGCRDIDEDSDEEMDISIQVNFNDSIATLTGDDLMPKRESDSY